MTLLSNSRTPEPLTAMRPSFLLVCLAALCLPSGASAQGSAPETGRDTVYLMPRLDVVGSRDQARGIPGSASVLDARTIERSRPFTTNEALRKLPGLAVRDEEGIGLRPNVGVRGLNPTRSTKVTLLEDGIPLAYAPYGDNASYYHPPVERFEVIELMKGAGLIQFGPQTIGGLINYITPTPPDRLQGFVAGNFGNRDQAVGRARVGGRDLLLDYTRKESDGARENMHSEINDLNFKSVIARSVTLRANYFRESSQLTYSGLTQAEFERLGARYNPFENDDFQTRRLGASATHHLALPGAASLTTNLYVSNFERDWWRQSSSTSDGQIGAGAIDRRLAGEAIDPDTIRSIQGRLREYTTWGVEPRFKLANAVGLRGELQAGVRAHFESQDRRQVNGTSSTARAGTVVEDNLRKTRAYSAFLVNRFDVGTMSFTPGVRYEHVHSARTNRLPGGVEGTDDLDRWIPSFGATWKPTTTVTAFAGVHGGFAPPRTEDVIAATGTSTDVGPEESVNWELGGRFAPTGGAELQATAFRNDFRRLIAVGSIAGGSTPLAEGEALFMGAELSGRYSHPSGVYLRGAYTWVPEAEQSTAFRQVVGGATVAGSVAGNRQPYAPEHLVTASTGFAWRGFDLQIEAVHVGEQFADFANTVAPSADGQRGRLAATTIWNAAANYDVRGTGATAFLTFKNLADETYIVDRTRGIQVGSPRLVQAGVKYAFGATE
jgi:Fe(3+) dicitrate transport protein